MIKASQKQTADSFGFQWNQKSGFDTPETRAMTKAWLLERYGNVANAEWWKEYGDHPKVLDAGCGAGLSAIEMFESILHKIDYLGIDISDAYQVAAGRFEERALPGRFEQGDMTNLKVPDNSFDVILAEGTLHHTDFDGVGSAAFDDQAEANGPVSVLCLSEKIPDPRIYR